MFSYKFDRDANKLSHITIALQACVALQILAETGKEISDSLVEKGCHQILFNLLESDEDAGGCFNFLLTLNEFWRTRIQKKCQ